MATQFDATARINVDLRGFSQAASAVTRSGGAMSTVFRNMHQQLNQLEIVSKKQAANLTRTLSVYNQLANAARNYAAAIQSLNRNTTQTANGAQVMAKAFQQLRSALAGVQGLSAREAERLGRTVALYNQLAGALQRVARSYQIIRSVGQADRQQSQAAERNALAAQRLRVEQERLAISAQRAANAQQRLNQQLAGSGGNSNLLRQDLSELASVYQQLGQVVGQSAVAVANAAISHEAAFAQIARVTQTAGPALAELREEFERLSTMEPVSFEELARIGQLGAQSGIAADALGDFARVVTQFSVTTGVSSERVTQFLGRIREMQDLDVSELRQFSSSVLAVGTASAATEEEILNLVQSISTTAVNFGLLSEDITGLSGALASLRVPPEWARGTLTRVFRDLDVAVKQGGGSLQALEQIMGKTGKELQALRKNDPGEFFRQFIQSMNQFADSSKSTGENTKSIANALGDLGITAVRDVDLISRLATNFDVLNSQSAIAFDEFAKGTELMDQTAIIYDTVKVRLDNLIDAFKTFISTIGTPLLAPIGAVASALTDIFEAFNTAPDWSIWAASALVAFAAIGAAIKLTQALMFRFIRAGIAMRQTQQAIGSSSLRARDMMRAYREETGRTAQAQQALGRAQRQSVTGAVAVGRASQTAARAAQGYSASLRAQASELQRSADAATRQAQRLEALAQRQRRAAATGIPASGVPVNRAAETAIRAQTQAMAQYDRAARLTAQSNTLVGQSAAILPTRFQAATAGVRAFTAAVGVLRAALSAIAIGLAITAITGFITSLTDMKSETEEFANSALEAAGGVQAFKDALADDTAARRNKSSIDQIRVGYDNLNASQRAQADHTAATAQSQRNLNTVLGDYAPRAQTASKETLKLGGSFDKAASSAGKMTFAIDEKVIKQRLNVVAKAVEQFTKSQEVDTGWFGISDTQPGFLQGDEGAKRAARLQEEFSKVAEALRGKNGIAGAAKIAEENAAKAREEMQKFANEGGKGDTVRRLRGDMKVWEGIEAAIRKAGGTEKEAAAALSLLGNEMDKAKVKAGTFADELGLSEEAATKLAGSFEGLSAGFLEGFQAFDITPLQVWTKAIDEAGSATKASLDDWVNAFDSSLKSVQNWSTNLLKLSTQLPSDVVAELAKMGPQGARLVEQMLGADAETRAKLVASVRLGTEQVQTEYTAGLAKLGAVLKAQGKGVQKQLADNLSAAFLDIAASGGSVDTALTQLSGAFSKLDKLKIEPEVLFDRVKTVNDFNAVIGIIDSLAAAKKAKIDIDIDDAPAKLSLEQLEQWVRLQEIQGLLDAKGEAAMEDKNFRSKVEELAALVLSKEQLGELDANGDGKFNDKEFRALFQALIDFVLGNKSKLDAEGKADLRDLITGKLNGIIQVMDGFNGKTVEGNANLQDNVSPKLQQIRTAMANFSGSSTTAYANVVQTTYRRQIDQGSRGGSVMAATGGYISGPGGPRDDKISAWLSNGEYVINARATRKHRALLDKINASGQSAASTMPFHYASGGIVTGSMRTQNTVMAQAAASITRAGDAMVSKISRLSDRKVQLPRENFGPVITVNNTYPRDEPTSITINRALAYSAALNGTL